MDKVKITKEYILELLETNDAALCRALVVLNERQTTGEQLSKTTNNDNGRGFLVPHAEIGTGMAEYFLKHGKLTPGQMAVWRKKTATGRMKIGIYAGQLLQIAKEKQKTNSQQEYA